MMKDMLQEYGEYTLSGINRFIPDPVVRRKQRGFFCFVAGMPVGGQKPESLLSGIFRKGLNCGKC